MWPTVIELASAIGKTQRVANHAALVDMAKRLETAAAKDASLQQVLQGLPKWKALEWLLF